jgi:ABC-2 type transport system permease protein
MNAFAFLIRRETWEHKGLYRGPVITTVVLISLVVLVLVRASIGGLLGAGITDNGLTVDMLAPHYVRAGSPIVMSLLYGIIFTVSTFIAVVYLLDSLYAERKNRSILFWKSLPISDSETVLAKLATATLLVPLVAIASVVAGWLILQIIAAVTIGSLGGNGWVVLWQPGVFFNGLAIAIKATAGLILWYLPLAGWLLLVSAWAQRSVFLWAILPPATLFFIERWLFGSRHFLDLVGDRLVGFQIMVRESASLENLISEGMQGSADVSVPEVVNQMVSFTKLLAEPGLYGGILVAAVFVTGAVFLRRYRDES